MQLNVFQSDSGYVLAEPGVFNAGLAKLRHGTAPDPIGWVQSIHLPVAASIEILDAVSRRTVAFLPFAKARQLGLEGLIQSASR